MGKPDMNKKINIIHVLEFIFSVIVAVCLADNVCINCGNHIMEMQFITASAFGFLMITSVIFFGLFFAEDVGPKSDLCYDALGGVMCLTSGILVLIFVNKSDFMEDYNYYRLLIGGACFIVNGIIFIVEFFILLFNKEKLDE